MENIKELIDEIFQKESLIFAAISNIQKGVEKTFKKIDIKPVLIKGERLNQVTYHYDNKVLHENLTNDESAEKLKELMVTYFRQAMLYTIDSDYQVLISKKGKVKILRKQPTRNSVDLSHNRKKAYLLEEGIPHDFLVKLGVMNQDGKVLTKKYDKFRQLNRYIEMVADCIPHLPKDRAINIIDFGCGKAYLTFALYYYLVKVMDLKVNIIGLDLKTDVIDYCNKVAEELDYQGLKFLQGDIRDYTQDGGVDMVVTLHACDTATDDALVKAVGWDASVILAVPCCQHEFFKKIHNPVMEPMEKHGLIKERMSSLVTDSLRANVLEILGYQVQVLEFIDMEHTPKNILIRAFKKEGKVADAIEEYKKFKQFWHLEPYIEQAMGHNFTRLIRDGVKE
ncbi:class I SAM-dependent methyltransferase [Fusibacter sp. JL216-2]|uniref:class I SAM-dependent methyltransferase n=1 Tax=Fusibacter sp. JL216-2 TaxID=3071453 RepID=UPI003D3382A2